MGDEPRQSASMTQICWSLMDRISRILEPDERDAVRVRVRVGGDRFDRRRGLAEQQSGRVGVESEVIE